MDSIWIGTATVLVGGIMTGVFPIPLKLARRWNWENTWLLYSLTGLILAPWLVAAATVPNLFAAFEAAGTRTLAITALLGLGWGTANVLFGLSVALVGAALTFAVVGGLSASCGSLIPLLLVDPARMSTTGGMVILLGVAMTVLGVAVLGVAGRRREAALAERGLPKVLGAGLLLSIAAGLLGPMLNYSFVFGAPIAQAAQASGAAAAEAVNAIWAIAFLGGFAGNAGYACIRLLRNRTWDRFRLGRREWLLGLAMGLLFAGGFILYGRGARALGDLGPVVGWPVFQATTIIAAGTAGAMAGEWKNAGRGFIALSVVGLSILVAAIVVLSVGNRL